MIALLLAAAALTAPWTPLRHFNLQCTGTETAYHEVGGQKVSMPWAQTFQVDLDKGSFCSGKCAKSQSLGKVDGEGVELENSKSADGLSLKRFHAASGAIETNYVVAGSANDHLHIERSGNCKITAATKGS